MASAATTSAAGSHVCVIGTGVLGLLAIKNLKEQGLRVTALERNDYLGGTWHVSPKTDQTSAMALTTANVSKESGSFTDFPFPEGSSVHPTAKELENYLEAYAKEFELIPHIQFSKEVIRVERDETQRQWAVYTRKPISGHAAVKEERQTFDRVVVATGILNVKNVPKIKGIEKFEGEAIHSQQFRDPLKYEGKNVVVLGSGATAADTLSFLTRANANKIYQSHRGQYYLLPRSVDGKPFSTITSRRAGTIVRALGSFWPRGCAALMSKVLINVRKKAFPWLSQHSSFRDPRAVGGILHHLPLFSDDLAENLKNGKVNAVHGIKEISGPRSVTLSDGTVLDDIDAIIMCAGYHYDFSVIQGPGNPIDPEHAPDHYRRIEAARFYSQDSPYPRLYRGFLSEQYPDSLAFLGHLLIMKPPFVLYDIVTMALGSIWSGAYPMPTAAEMDKDINIQYDFVVDTMNRGPMPHPGFRMISGETYRWLNEAAGTGVTDRLVCWTWKAWQLWWSNRRFYNLLVDGVDVPAVYRLFETGKGRKPWAGAKTHIEKTNDDIKQMVESWKKDQSSKHK